MHCKPLAVVAATLLAGASHGATLHYVYEVLDDSARDVGLLALTDSPGYVSATLTLDLLPRYDFSFGYDPAQGYPGGDIVFEYADGVMQEFAIDLFICNPDYGNCNFSTVWSLGGDAVHGSVYITNYPDDPNSYGYALLAVPEPPAMPLLLAGAALAGLAIRRRQVLSAAARQAKAALPGREPLHDPGAAPCPTMALRQAGGG